MNSSSKPEFTSELKQLSWLARRAWENGESEQAFFYADKIQKI